MKKRTRTYKDKYPGDRDKMRVSKWEDGDVSIKINDGNTIIFNETQIKRLIKFLRK